MDLSTELLKHGGSKRDKVEAMMLYDLASASHSTNCTISSWLYSQPINVGGHHTGMNTRK